MNTYSGHEHEHELAVSISHRRSLRLRLASALVAAILVVTGVAGIGSVAPGAVESVFAQAQDP